MIFYLGTHRPNWLAKETVPLFVSRRTLMEYKTLPRATGPWALDSGGFTELSLHGRYQIGGAHYASECRRIVREVGHLQWAAIQDWMCEPHMLQKTGLTIRQHQVRTVESYVYLTGVIGDEVNFIPVLQGWERVDYLRCVRMYEDVGVDLTKCPTVGLGSVCRRQATGGIADLIRELYGMGIRLHAFGFKINGLRESAKYLASSDSMAWSYKARHEPPLEGCTHKTCANCKRYALRWRNRVLKVIESAESVNQPTLF